VKKSVNNIGYAFTFFLAGISFDTLQHRLGLIDEKNYLGWIAAADLSVVSQLIHSLGTADYKS
jgi:hypothetical protein